MKFNLFICLFVFSSLLPRITINQLPSIYAICQVELKNGEVKEGMITLGEPDDKMYNTHGFYFETQTVRGQFIPDELVQFDLEFDYLCFKGKACYVENKTYLLMANKLDNINDSILTKTTEQNYQIGKKMVLHKKPEIKWYIGSNLFYKNTMTDDLIEIDISEISTFKLLKKPSTEWIELINRIYDEYPEIDKRDKPITERGGVLWYHDVVNNPELKQELEKYFYVCFLNTDF